MSPRPARFGAASSQAGAAPREEPLRALGRACESLALTSWRGRSGRRYVASRHAAEMPEIAETVEAVVVAVRRGRGGIAEAIGSAAFEPLPSPRERLGWIAAMRARGASEMHVHLADGRTARRAALADLGGSAEI